jgi:hypothetical protein
LASKQEKRYVSHPHTGGKQTTDHKAYHLLDGFTCLLHGQTEVLLGGHHTNSVGVAHTAAPSLDTDDGIALVDDAELETVVDGPLETAVDVLLPDLDIEVGLGLGEVEGPDTAVQVRVLGNLSAENDTRRSDLNLRGKRWRYG